MKTAFALFLSFAVLTTAGCSQPETDPAKPAAEASGQAGSLGKIPMLPGYKYYVGGPTMKRDQYGRFRIQKFNGEVAQPPSRGMIFGAKQEGDKLEYRVWGNGRLLGLHRGTMRDGVFWKEYGESYRDEKIVSRTREVSDDEAKRTKVTVEDIDPENGEVIRTTDSFVSFLPPAIPKDVKDELEDVPGDTKQGDMEPVGSGAAAEPEPAPAPEKKGAE